MKLPQGTDPRKMVRTSIAFGAVVLVIWVLTLQGGSELISPDVPTDIRSQQRLDSLRIALNKDVPVVDRQQNDVGSNVWVVFVLMGASLAVLYWYFGKSDKMIAQTGFAKEIANQELTNGARLVIVEMTEELWIFSQMGGTMSLLEKRPLSDAHYFEKEVSDAPTFSSVLSKIGGNRGK